MSEEKECLYCGKDFKAWDNEIYCESCEDEIES